MTQLSIGRHVCMQQARKLLPTHRHHIQFGHRPQPPAKSRTSKCARSVTARAKSDDNTAEKDLTGRATSNEGSVKGVAETHSPAATSSQEQPADAIELSAQQASLSPFAKVAAATVLVSPFFFWGTSMVGMKMVAPHTSPLFVSAWRLLPAGFLLVGWAAGKGRPQPSTPAAWGAISVFALVNAACFQGFLAKGLQRTSAGLGSVIIDSQPLTVALLASFLFGETLTGVGYLGLLVGIGGLLLLEVPPDALGAIITSPDLTSLKASISSGGSIWDSGEWWMLLSAQSMAVGTVMVRWVTKYCDPVMATGWHMVLGSLPLIALSIAQEGTQLQERLPQLTGSDAAILLYISVLGSAASYGVFFYNASRGNLTALSSLTFLTPMFAALGGFFLLGETLTPLQLTGAAITLGAVALINTKGSQTQEGA